MIKRGPPLSRSDLVEVNLNIADSCNSPDVTLCLIPSSFGREKILSLDFQLSCHEDLNAAKNPAGLSHKSRFKNNSMTGRTLTRSDPEINSHLHPPPISV